MNKKDEALKVILANLYILQRFSHDTYRNLDLGPVKENIKEELGHEKIEEAVKIFDSLK